MHNDDANETDVRAALSNEADSSDNGIGIDGENPEKEEVLAFLSSSSLCASNLDDRH